MDTLDDLNAHRHDIAKKYEEAFDDKGVIPIPEGGSAVYTRFPVMAKQGQIPGELKRLGVRRMYPKAIAEEDNIKHHFANDLVPTPGASEIAGNLITLPTHMGITEALAKKIARKAKDFFGIQPDINKNVGENISGNLSGGKNQALNRY